MSLLPLFRTAGSLPLSQLTRRAKGSTQDVLGELNILVQEGLVRIEGNEVPQSEDQLRSSNAMASLTVTGTRRVFR